MNKGDLVARIAKEAGLTKTQEDAAVSSLFAGITGALKKNQKATIVGFGTFSVTRRCR